VTGGSPSRSTRALPTTPTHRGRGATIDRFGRRPLLLMGPVGMAVTPGTLAVIFGTAPLDREGQPRLSGAAGPVALVVAKLYVFAFGMSWGPVVWVMLGEKFPNRIRAAALGVARPRRGSPTG
jgi:MFS transporter, SP family, sugar:H+ symporter